MGTNPVPCLQGKLALRLQETSAPEFVDLIFQTLKLVSGGQTGWQRGQAEAKERQRKEQEAGEYQGRGSCGTFPLFNMHLPAGIPLETKPPADRMGWQQSHGHQVFGGTDRKRGDRAEGLLDNSCSLLTWMY